MSQHERAATPPASQDGGYEQSMSDAVENIEEQKMYDTFENQDNRDSYSNNSISS